MTWQPKNLTREQLAERRAEAVRLLEAGEMKQVEIARHLGVTEAAVSKWKRQLAEEGPQALQLRKATGRPPKLDEAAKQALVKKLEEGAVAAGFPTEQWTQARVKKVIGREFGFSYAEPVSFTWAPKGKTPQLKRITKFRRETSTMVGLTISGKIYKRHFDGSINAEKLLV